MGIEERKNDKRCGNKDQYLVYKLVNNSSLQSSQNGHSVFTILKPTICNVYKFAKNYYLLAAWWFFHLSGVFYNKLFSMIVCFENKQIIHRTCVFPGFYKFPFMKEGDMQLGEIWTREDCRNRGLATNAMRYILNMSQYKNKTFWYVVESSNQESIMLAKKAGFVAICMAQKKSKMGISMLGKYEISAKSEFKQ